MSGGPFGRAPAAGVDNRFSSPGTIRLVFAGG